MKSSRNAAARPRILAAALAAESFEPAAFEALRDAFVRSNPGYDLAWHPAARRLEPEDAARVVFVQAGACLCGVASATLQAEEAQELTSGDLVNLRPGESLSLTGALDLLVFTTPERLPASLPTFVRPDFDPNITDTPGGCAEEDDAYRRILLTWKEEVGPYTYHSLNAHRVRINDSFTHYHPLEGGFDEFYLVQLTEPGAVLLTSEATARVITPDDVALEEAQSLLEARPLHVGDLVYLPRGTIHRGLGGAVVQVITAPGFRPGAEIGVDHHLRAIGERLGLSPEELPYRASSARSAVVK